MELSFKECCEKLKQLAKEYLLSCRVKKVFYFFKLKQSDKEIMQEIIHISIRYNLI
jgi:hypothetical protein